MMDPLTAAVVVLAVLVILICAAAAGLYRRVRELELAVYKGVGLNITDGHGGGDAPVLSSPGHTSIILKINRRCPVCEELLAAAARLASRVDDAELVVLSDDPGFDRNMPDTVRVVRDPDAWRAVTVPYVPAILVVDERGTVVYTAPGGSPEVLERVIEQFVNNRKEAGV